MYALQVRTTKDMYDEIRKCSTFTITPRFEVKLFSCKSKKIP